MYTILIDEEGKPRSVASNIKKFHECERERGGVQSVCVWGGVCFKMTSAEILHSM